MMDRRPLNGLKIKRWMAEKGIDAAGLAARLGISVTLARSMLGGYVPRRDPELVLEALASLMGCEVKDLFLSPTEMTAA